MKELKDYIQSSIFADENELELFLSRFEERTIKKGKFILRQGQLCTNYFFIKAGVLRIYFDANGKQVTGWIALEGEFFTELSSLKNQQPTHFNIQALTDTHLLFISNANMESLYKQFPRWQQFGRHVWETAFLRIVDGILSFQTLTAEERYLKLMNQTDLLQNVSLKDLSSFLGITPTSLSRLRKNIT